MALARLKLLKSPSFLNESSNEWDDDFTHTLEAATAIACKFTGRALEKTTYQNELYTGNNTSRLFLREYPVQTIIAVELWNGLDDYDEETSTYYALINKRYIQYPALGQESNAAWSKWLSTYENGIRISYVAGYDSTGWASKGVDVAFGIEADLEYAVCSLAQLVWMDGKKGGARRGVQSASVGFENLVVEKYVAGLPADVQRILHTYRRLNV
ncbi:hypothetical protein AMJ86_01135 [bacterium SM23_57]|nr:MAG: hypothetical protein AMJ86_01135 [bacterium SM23_57]